MNGELTQPWEMTKRKEYEHALERGIENAMKLSVTIGLFLSYFAVFYGYSIAASFFIGLAAIFMSMPILILVSVALVSLM